MPNPIQATLLPADDQIHTVSQITKQVKTLLESHLSDCWVRGEISNFRRQSSGHCYFSLKDHASVLSAVIFRGDASRVNLELRDGQEVIAFGRVNVYEPRGTYQLIIRFVVDDGAGRLQMEFERLKKLLADEGLFESEQKKPLPLLPQTIGIITSPTGAAVRDFISILKRHDWRGKLIVLPVKVQGEGAAEEIASMLNMAPRLQDIDLIMLGRGGGSLEDLWPFNEEKVVRAIAACDIPVTSAVGHEIDYTLSDFVADHRAETPSAAAEYISRGYHDCQDRIRRAADFLEENIQVRVERLHNRLDLQESHLIRLSPKQLIEHHYLRLDDVANRLQALLKEGISTGREQLGELATRLYGLSPEGAYRLAALKFKAAKDRYTRFAINALDKPSTRIEQLSKRLNDVGPQQTLMRGFVLVRDEKGNIVSRKKGITKGLKLKNQFYDGDIIVEVTEN